MKKGPRFGTSMNKANSALCMVVGCNKKALYRSVSTAQRGYCTTHKAHAVQQRAETTIEAQARYVLREH